MDEFYKQTYLNLQEKWCVCTFSWDAWLYGCEKLWWLQSTPTKDDHWTKTTEQGVDILHSCRGNCLGLCTWHARAHWRVSSIYRRTTISQNITITCVMRRLTWSCQTSSGPSSHGHLKVSYGIWHLSLSSRSFKSFMTFQHTPQMLSQIKVVRNLRTKSTFVTPSWLWEKLH